MFRATPLGQSLENWSHRHGENAGVYPLSQGMDALGARLGMIERAELSIDLQYFLMKDDTAGLVLTQALLKAADRGVRVRFLLDDIFTTAPDRNFLLMDQHPNIEVRLFNPVSRTGLKALNFVGHFRQANRRMHNKSFIVDNTMAIIGGRNIANEYFQLTEDSVFLDFDMLIIGAVVRDLSSSFDDFWNHERALPIKYVAKRRDESLDALRSNVDSLLESVYLETFDQALDSEVLQNLIAGREALRPASVRVIADSPEKLTNAVSQQHMLLARSLRDVMMMAEDEIIAITPYYVPGDEGVDLLRQLTARGVKVKIVTNSLASNNHVPVHRAYSRYRRDVLSAGADIYEARVNSGADLSGDEDAPATLTMHTKVFLIDRRFLFVGSVNLDPRSLEINSEMGVLIEEPEYLAGRLNELDEELAKFSYKVQLGESGRLEWHGLIDGQEVVKHREPDTTWLRRVYSSLMWFVPESQL